MVLEDRGKPLVSRVDTEAVVASLVASALRVARGALLFLPPLLLFANVDVLRVEAARGALGLLADDELQLGLFLRRPRFRDRVVTVLLLPTLLPLPLPCLLTLPLLLLLLPFLLFRQLLLLLAARLGLLCLL